MADQREDRIWWPFGPPREDIPRLFCLPFAGAGASVFREWRRAAPAALDVCPVQLPGREGRLREAAACRLEPLAERLAEELQRRAAAPYSLFGYSMGALIAFETAHRLRARDVPPPRALFVAAAAAPHRRDSAADLHTLPDGEFRAALRDLAGTPAEVLEHEELMELLLPTLRADFELCETYRPPERPLLDCPIIALAGSEDASVGREARDAWGDLTSGSFRTVLFPGGHFFLEEQGAAMRAEVEATLAAGSSPERGRGA